MIRKTCAVLAVLSGGWIMPAGAAEAADPETASDEARITINGIVDRTHDESFRLDYGEGTITVTMEDWDWYREYQPTMLGDQVTVQGYIDDDFLENRTIDADSVYVDDLKTWYFAGGAREGDMAGRQRTTPTLVVPPGSDYDEDWVMNVTGTVAAVDGRTFKLNVGDDRQLVVDTSTMEYNPMDDEGEPKIDVGDLVSVSGPLDPIIFEKKQIQANSITTLREDLGKSAAARSATGNRSAEI